jgi:hypothetical protein
MESFTLGSYHTMWCWQELLVLANGAKTDVRTETVPAKSRGRIASLISHARRERIDEIHGCLLLL